MLNGNGLKLTGDDAFGRRAAVGALIEGDGVAALDPGVYFVVAVAAVSGFPAPAGTGTEIAAGNFIQVNTGITIIPEVGDDVREITLTDICDISSFTMELAKTEIDVTTLCDLVKKYRSGRPDMTGTQNGVFKVGETDDPTTGLLREFLPIVQQDGGTSYDVYAQENQILLGFFYVNKSSLADEMYVVAPYILQGITLGAEIDAAQTFSSGFRFADFTIDGISVIPTFYRIGDGA
jgi:hypothetical protein